MSGTFDHYQRYNDLVKLITQTSATDYPAAKLILHVMEQQYEKTGQLAFAGNTYFPEADAFNQTINGQRESATTNSVSEYWVDALNEFANAPSDAGSISFDEMKNAYDRVSQKAFAAALVDSMYTFNDPKKTLKFTEAVSSRSKITVKAESGTAIEKRLGLAGIYNNQVTGNRSAINGIKSSLSRVSYNGTKTNLPFKLDRVILTLLLEGAFKQSSQTSSGPSSTNFFSSTGSATVPEDKDLFFYRRLGEPEALYRRNADGTESRVEKGSPEFMKLQQSNNCYTTGFQETKGLTCLDLVKDCLKGKNISDCKNFMKSSSWDQNLVKENVTPDIALDLLKRFGFGTKTVQVDEIGRNLEMIEDYDDWIKNLSDNFVGGSGQLKPGDLTSIAQNSKLTGYLKRLIAIINSNPGILNKDYVGKANLSTNPSAFANTQLGKFGLLPKQVIAASGVPNMSSVLSLQNAVMGQRNRVSVAFGIMPQGVIFQRGGGMSTGIAEVLEQAQNNSEFPLKLSKLMDESFKSFVASLKSHGKDLDSSDMAHINSLIGELKDKENKLFKAAIYTDKYIRLLGAIGKDSDSTSVLKLDHVKDFVDRRNSYFTKVNKKQDDLFAILKALADAAQQETKEEVKSVTNYPRF